MRECSALTRRGTVYAILILLLAHGLRVAALGAAQRFHPDEALFADFARGAAVHGQWMLPGTLDKPPLSPYIQALTMHFIGVTTDEDGLRDMDIYRGEFAARLPSMWASVLVVALTIALAKRLYRSEGAGLAAGLIIATSPYAVAFAPTAFTDGPMRLAVMLALWSAVRGRGISAGLWAAVAVGCKQQAMLWVPLVAWVRITKRARPCLAPTRYLHWTGLFRFVGAFAAGLLMLLGWDAARSDWPSVLVLAIANNAPPGPVIEPAEGLMRLGVWVNFLLRITPALPLVVFGVSRGVPRTVLLHMVGYSALHIVVPFNQYDRYLVPLVPLIAMLAGGGAVRFFGGRSWQRGRMRFRASRHARARAEARPSPARPRAVVVPILVSGSLIFHGWLGVTGTIGVGGDMGRHTGIDDLAAYLNAREFGAIVYDHWLGWELNYYLGAWTDKRRAYYPSPDAMIADPAVRMPDAAPRYLPAPADADVLPWVHALREAGFDVRRGYDDGRFVVWVLQERAVEDAG